MTTDRFDSMRIDASMVQARARALAGVYESLARIGRPASDGTAAIPVTVSGWRTVLEDARVCELARSLLVAVEEATAIDANDARVIGTHLRVVLGRAVASFQELVDAMERQSWFDPPAACAAERADVVEVVEVAGRLLHSVLEMFVTDQSFAAGRTAEQAAASLDQIIGRLGADREPDTDVTEDPGPMLVFGATARPLTDRRGILSAARIHAAFFGREDALARIGRRVLGTLLSGDDGPTPDWGMFVAPLALSTRPFVCHEVARQTLALMLNRYALEPSATVATIGRLFSRIPQSASTHFDGLAMASARLKDASSAPERARIQLERYRLATEGQLRHTAWAVLELHGHHRNAVPSMAEVCDLLRSTASPLTDMMLRPLQPEWRNAAAHEQHHWDPKLERLIFEVGSASPEELDHATAYALSAVDGFEIGVGCARLHNPLLATALDAVEPPGQAALVDLQVRRVFGQKGLWVWDTEWSRGNVEIVLDGADNTTDVHLLLACILEGNMLAPSAGDWRISDRDGPGAIEVGAAALAKAAKLLPPNGERLQANVLIPLLASAKQRRGTPASEVARDILRLALKHPLVVAQDEADLVVRRDIDAVRRLVEAIDLALQAIDLAWNVVGSDGGQRSALDDLSCARDATTGLEAGDDTSLAHLANHINRLLDIYHSLPEAPLLEPMDQAVSSDADKPVGRHRRR